MRYDKIREIIFCIKERAAFDTKVHVLAFNQMFICCSFSHSKDVRLPVQLQRVMAAEAEATREARAKVTLKKNP